MGGGDVVGLVIDDNDAGLGLEEQVNYAADKYGFAGWDVVQDGIRIYLSDRDRQSKGPFTVQGAALSDYLAT